MISTNETAYCQVDVPGTGMTIQLRLNLLERLAMDVRDVLSSSGRESGGILLGSIVSGKTLFVEDYDPLPSRHVVDSRCYFYSDVDRSRMASALSLWRPPAESRLHVIGFYRSNVRPTLNAEDEDTKLFAQELADATSLLLLVEPSANGRIALACYLAESGQFRNREARLDIDGQKPEAVTAMAPAAGTESRREVKPLTGHDRGEKSSSGLTWIAVVPVATGLLWLGFLQYQILNTMRVESAAVRRLPALGLEVQPVGSYWRLSWNRSSECLAGAARGHLRIEDGSTEKGLDFDAAELKTTSVFYAPAGNDIRFHLEVYGAQDGRSTVESLRVFASLPPASADTGATGSLVLPADRVNAAGISQGPSESNGASVRTLPLH